MGLLQDVGCLELGQLRRPCRDDGIDLGHVFGSSGLTPKSVVVKEIIAIDRGE